MWLHLTKQLSLENLPFRHACTGTTHKIAVAYLCCPHLVRGQVSECKTSIFELAKFEEHLLSIPISWEHCLNDFFGDRAKTFMVASALSLSVEFLFLPQWPYNTSCTVPSTQTCLGFLLLLLLCMLLVVVVYQIQPSNVVELQQHSPLSNNTSVTIYVHRMIISPPCLFKHMNNDECVAMFSQYLLDHI